MKPESGFDDSENGPTMRKEREEQPTAATELEYARNLLGRALDAFVPNHDEANDLAKRIGLGDLPNADLVEEIRAFIRGDHG